MEWLDKNTIFHSNLSCVRCVNAHHQLVIHSWNELLLDLCPKWFFSFVGLFPCSSFVRCLCCFSFFLEWTVESRQHPKNTRLNWMSAQIKLKIVNLHTTSTRAPLFMSIDPLFSTVSRLGNKPTLIIYVEKQKLVIHFSFIATHFSYIHILVIA